MAHSSIFRRASWRDTVQPASDHRLDGVRLEGPSGQVVASRVEGATTPFRRARGLLGREVGTDTALLLAPCSQVHTVGMRTSIDTVFCDRELGVLWAETLPPGRVSRHVRGAWCCFELPAGAAVRHGLDRGVSLRLTRPGEPG